MSSSFLADTSNGPRGVEIRPYIKKGENVRSPLVANP